MLLLPHLFAPLWVLLLLFFLLLKQVDFGEFQAPRKFDHLLNGTVVVRNNGPAPSKGVRIKWDNTHKALSMYLHLLNIGGSQWPLSIPPSLSSLSFSLTTILLKLSGETPKSLLNQILLKSDGDRRKLITAKQYVKLPFRLLHLKQLQVGVLSGADLMTFRHSVGLQARLS